MNLINKKNTLASTLIIATLLCLGSSIAQANKKSAPEATERKDLVADFRCEKFSGSLGDLKLKLIETCNLDKPFSSSMTRTLNGDDVYMYCCHKN